MDFTDLTVEPMVTPARTQSSSSNGTALLAAATQPLPESATKRKKNNGKVSDIWLLMEANEKGGCRCTKCGRSFTFAMYERVSRVEKHFQICPQLSEGQQKEMIDNFSKKRMKQCNITSLYVPQMSVSEKHQVALHVAEYMYVEAIPFSKVESLCDLLAKLRPDIIRITRRDLQVKYLHTVYDKYCDRLNEALTADLKVCLTSDAWTNVNGESVVNHMIISPSNRKTYFLDAVFTGKVGHTAEWLAEDMSNAIETVNNKAGDKVCAGVCTDNTNANKAMWASMSVKYPKMFFYGCTCHGVHLIAKDMISQIKWISDLLEEGKTVVKFFKRRSMEKAILKENGAKVSLKLPGETKEAKEVRLKVKSVVQNDQWVNKMKVVVALLEVTAKYILMFQNDYMLLSDVYEMFNNLPGEIDALSQKGLPQEDVDRCKQIIAERWVFQYSDAHGIAYTIDPRYNGKNIRPFDMELVKNYMTEWDPEMEVELVEYFAHVDKETKNKHSSIHYINNFDSPHCISVLDWWNAFRGTKFSRLKQLALTIFSCTTSSSASERNFSTFAYIHSKLRNRLSNSTVEKLVYIFVNSKKLNQRDAGNKKQDLEYKQFIDSLLNDDDDEDDEGLDSRVNEVFELDDSEMSVATEDDN